MSKNSMRQSLSKHNLAPHKRFGQNFLVHKATAAAIAHCAHITEEDTVVEVGVGLGALTQPLALAAKKVIGVEIDNGLIRYHKEEKLLPDNVMLIHDDILKVKFEEIRDICSSPLILVANLPYSISNPFIFKLIENRQYIDRVVVMLQKEVADRLTAQPATKEYGIPTVLLNGCATIERLMTLKPHEFHPQPKIDSVVLRINFSNTADRIVDQPLLDYTLFQRLVRSAFAKRRKTLINNLLSLDLFCPSGDKKECRKNALAAIIQAGLSPQSRAETLTGHDFAKLSVEVSKITNITDI